MGTLIPADQAIGTRRAMSRAQIMLLILMVSVAVMSYCDRTLMSLAGPGIMKEFSISETEMGSIYSAFIFSYSVLMVPWGYLADRLGARWVLTTMGLGSALFTGLTALGGRPGLGTHLGVVPSFALLRLGMGTFTSPIFPALARMNANWISIEKRARTWGFVSAGAGVGGTLSPLIFPPMILLIGWKGAFWVAAGATVVLTLIWHFSVRDHPTTSVPPSLNKPASAQEKAPAPLSLLLRNRSLVALTLSYFAVGYFQYIFWYWMYYYFGQIRHFSPEQSAVYTSSLFLAWVISAPLGGWMADRLSHRFGRTLARRSVSMVSLTMSAVLLYFSATLSSALAVGTVVAFAMGSSLISDASFWATAMDLGGKQVGAATALLNTGGNLGGVLTTILTPYIASYYGWTGGLYFGCFVVLVGVLLWLWVDQPPARKLP